MDRWWRLQAANALRKRHRIRVKGAGRVPPPLQSFEELAAVPGCPPGLIEALQGDPLQGGLGCATPTPIQRQAVSVLLAGLELLAVAPTGASAPTEFSLVTPPLETQRRIAQDRGAAHGWCCQPSRSCGTHSIAAAAAVSNVQGLGWRLTWL